jgi:RNA polymerase sigma-70 factor (ECF subfamily)
MVFEAALSKDLPLGEPDEAVRLRRREPAALAAAVARYQHRLYRYLYRLVREPAAAEDLYQQTWLNVVRRIGTYDARSKFDTWLFAIAHNAAMDFLRRSSAESLDETTMALPAGAADAFTSAMASERTAILETALANLPAVYREALTLRFEEGMKLEEIAEVTRVPLSTAKSRVQRALESLRQRMAPKWRKEDLL